MAPRFEIVKEKYIEELKDKSENENTRKSTEYWKNVFKKSRRMKATAKQGFHFATRRRRKPEFITFGEGET